MITFIIMVIIIAVVTIFSVQNASTCCNFFFLMEIRGFPCTRFISHCGGRCGYWSKCSISL